MRRFVALVLLALLPLQFSWAAVVACCEHIGVHEGAGDGAGEGPRDAAATGHFGHHEHTHGHRADAGASAGADGSTPNADHPDCGACHGGCTVLPAASSCWVPPATTTHPGAPAPGPLQTLAPTPPERPQWCTAA